MFRMGGPIKEGVMHGIREPHAGGSIAGGHQIGIPMGNRTGFQDPTFWSKLAAQYNPKNFASPKKFIQRINPFGRKLKTVTKIPKIAKNTWGILQPKITKGGIPGSTTGQTFIKNLKDFSIPGAARMKGWAGKVKDVAVRNPKTSLGAAYFGGLPIAASLPYKKIGSTLVDVAKWPLGFLPGGDDKKTEEVAKVVTEPIVEQFKPKVPTAAELAAIEAANDAKAASDKDKRLTDLLKIMNYDKSRKNAAYDALIDASEVIRETGFKDKSILPIVKATSARFDKPEQIKEAVGLMMAKGEIEKDTRGDSDFEKKIKMITGGDPKKIKQWADTQLGEKTIGELIPGVAKGLSKSKIDSEVLKNVMSIKEPNIIAKIIGNKDELEEIKEASNFTTIEDYVNKKEKGKPGIYIIDTIVVQIDENGNVKQRY